MKWLIWMAIIAMTSIVSATEMAQKNFSLDLENVSLPKAIYMLAKFLHRNVLISRLVQGNVTLHLQNTTADDVFHLLLVSHDLTTLQVGDNLYVLPRKEWVKRHQEQLQCRQQQEASSPLLMQSWQIHYAKAQEVAHILRNHDASFISRRGHITFDVRTNILCIQDTLSHLTQIKHFIQRIDVPVKQIVISARLVSVDQDFERELGVEFTNNNDNVSLELPTNHFSLAIAKLADGSFLDMRLAAMEHAGKGELISSPRLFTANQRLASIESGEEIPYQETSRNGATSVVFKKAVLSLRVVPQIMPNNNVLLQLRINQDRPNIRQVLGVPTIDTRQITTNILAKNGQTIVLGGIYESNREIGTERVPFLGKIPLIGLLFQHQNKLINKRELLIFVTPCIVSDTP